ncbi:hypothetical protein SDC9_201468 [bioreactor metagenome]|uniref:Uncharacterized protein n=1 Tax=bioreactor metagenome TaxID=1076179 RepID=A0A645ISK6_9ZZZZ
MLPRSEQPRAPRTPKPRSVKLNPLRTFRPMPSKGIHLISDVSTPPCRMKSSSSRPTGLSANAVTTPARCLKQRRRPRATLYSPPPSQTVKFRAVWILESPGSNRSMISPRETMSYRHSSAGRMASLLISISLPFLRFE